MQFFDTVAGYRTTLWLPTNGYTGPRPPPADKISFRKIVSYGTAVKKPFSLIRSDS